MARKGRSAGRNAERSTPGVVEVPKGTRPDGPVEGVYYIDTGDCELIADQDNSNGWLLKINGVMSSHIDLADPLFVFGDRLALGGQVVGLLMQYRRLR